MGPHLLLCVTLESVPWAAVHCLAVQCSFAPAMTQAGLHATQGGTLKGGTSQSWCCLMVQL